MTGFIVKGRGRVSLLCWLGCMAVAGLTACQPKQEILTGTRIDVRSVLETEEVDGTINTNDSSGVVDNIATDSEGETPAVVQADQADQDVQTLDDTIAQLEPLEPEIIVPITLPEQTQNLNWTQRGGNAAHFTAHAALGDMPALVWSEPIGLGSTNRLRLSADPIVTETAIFTLDSIAVLRAFDLNGGALWRQSLLPRDNSDSLDRFSGGGIAYDDGRLVVTTGYGEVIALTADSGDIIWRHKLSAPASLPAVQGDFAVVIAGNRQAVALDMAQGRVVWQQETALETSGLVGTGTPAIFGDFVVLPYGTGTVSLALLDSGILLWTQALSGVRLGSARAFITAVSGDPVVARDVIYTGTQSGTASALALKTGERLWVINDGAISPILPVDNSVFMLSDENKLVRRMRDSGDLVWQRQLPLYADTLKKRGNYAHFGPVLAGGRIYVAGSDGQLRGFDPLTGELAVSIHIPMGAGSFPVVAGGVLYLVAQDGVLLAFQ